MHTTGCCSDVRWAVHADDAVERVKCGHGLLWPGLRLDGLLALLLQHVKHVIVLRQIDLLDLGRRLVAWTLCLGGSAIVALLALRRGSWGRRVALPPALR